MKLGGRVETVFGGGERLVGRKKTVLTTETKEGDGEGQGGVCFKPAAGAVAERLCRTRQMDAKLLICLAIKRELNRKLIYECRCYE